jgi:23S rRNA (uridine2552-2'-O)-methyltransferase
VVDLGCWPGGWLQVASATVGPKGRVVGIDRASIDPPLELANVFALTGDLSNPACAQQILEALAGRADVVLSDAAPKLTGIRATDRAREEALLEAIEVLVPQLLATGGSAVVKLLDCPEAEMFRRRLAGRFAKSRVLKTAATRQGSAERYLVLTSFGP